MKAQHKNKAKRLLAFAVPAIALVAIGTTMAISHDRSVLNNKFRLAGYHTLFTEEFDAPQNWMTCETIDKTLTVTNDSDSSGAVAVRVRLEEQWIASDGVTELPLVSAASGLTMAQINFTPNSGWTKEGSYYYYDTDLAKGATTTSLITGVTLNCDANLDTTATAPANADGDYADATYKLKITAQTIDTENKDVWDTSLTGIIAKQVNDLDDYVIDFTRDAIVSSDTYTANGNGVNLYKENNQDIYYYRGQIDNNNVIWADKCWKIVRTTATGGTKMIYNGTPSDVVVDGETVKQCNATGTDSQITVRVNNVNKNTFKYNENYGSPADIGYMYGTRIEYNTLSDNSTTFIFSNDVSRNGNTYTLDTSSGQSLSGTWPSTRLAASARYHYFCTDGTAVCDNTKIGYINNYGRDNSISYLPLDGYDDIETLKAAMFANTTNSNAKNMVETWFEQQNLDGHETGTRNYEEDLEDAIFCNDRSFYSGSLKSKDSNAGVRASTYIAYGRNSTLNAQNNFEPSLDCSSVNDAFTKDIANGNGKLSHKIGLVTADELIMAAVVNAQSVYISSGQTTWSISPTYSNASTSRMLASYSRLVDTETYGTYGLRPLISLKAGTEVASGSGLATDPYIIE